jgi:uncharacterized protein (DUF58 family)
MKLPDLDELLMLRGAARSLSLHARGPARAGLLGGHRSAHRGRGLEFEEVRPYVAGDDVRSIDWRVTARRGRAHTKLFREEREQPVWLLADLNSGLFFGSRMQLKSMVAVRAAALLAWVAAFGGDRIGALVVADDEARVLKPRSREAGVLPILNALIELQPRAPRVRAAHGFQQALQTLAPSIHPGSLILTLSDFAMFDDDQQFKNAQEVWSALTARSESRWFWITDELERRALPDGLFRAGEPQRVVTVDGSRVRRDWLRAWRQREHRIAECAQLLHIALQSLDTGRSVIAVLQASLHAAGSVVAAATASKYREDGSAA